MHNLILQAIRDGETLVYGHRGAKAYAPMNTLPAFQLAAEQGAHGIELDVHRSKDGYPVIVHDFEVDETTNGTGHVTEMTLAELKALDAGSWFGPEFTGVRVPTLDEVFEEVGGRLFINVEIKSESVETDGVEEVVAECIRRHNMAARVLVSSFNPHTLRRFRAIMPEAPIGYLVAPAYLEELGVLDDLAYEAYHPYHEMINAEMVVAHAALGRHINAWTVNDPQRGVALRDMGVRGIITDAPDTMLAALRA
ncbi:MAG: glycerophosphodiester phosphodiesterase [Anaerolineae bacterium]|nr:glycerophosphodiester phosphodiesterase [Anaerolineae bacterium]MDW8171709.1 glycerophosphodiester phosphodiesterase family protein [Anaerolineae bacterium]